MFLPQKYLRVLFLFVINALQPFTNTLYTASCQSMPVYAAEQVRLDLSFSHNNLTKYLSTNGVLGF